MKVQCCCCDKTRVAESEWVAMPTRKLERVSFTYCPECYEEQVQKLRRAALLEAPRLAVAAQ